MHKTKQKPDSRWPIRFFSYAVLWMLIGGISVLFARVFQALDPLPLVTPIQAMLIHTSLSAFLVALFQALLTDRWFKRSMRGWVIYSMIGTLIVLFARVNPSLWNPYDDASVTLRSLVLMLAVPLFQALWLRRRVYRAWVWPVTHYLLLMGGTFLMRRNILTTAILHDLWTGLYGLFCGMVMIYLWSYPKDAEKAKVDVATNEQVVEARISRLQEHAHSKPLWDMGNDQALHSEA